MNPATIIALALQALQAVINVINEIKSQGGLTDDQIAAQVKTAAAGNDQAYAAIVAALGIQPKQ